jgi:hypothetical protein
MKASFNRRGLKRLAELNERDNSTAENELSTPSARLPMEEAYQAGNEAHNQLTYI